MPSNLLNVKALDRELRAARAEAAARNTRIKIRDGDNLMLVVRANGGASWVLEFRIDGHRKPLTLGAWPDIGLADARDRAAKARAEVAKGVDPLAQKVAQRAAQTSTRKQPADTVQQLLEDWLRKHRGSLVYKGNIRAAMIKDVLPKIGATAPQDVTRADIIAILRAMEDRDALVMLRRVKLWLKHMFDFAIDDERRPAVTASPVPSGHLTSFLAPKEGHFPAITDLAEIPGLMKAIRGYGPVLVRTALLLSAYVFQRPTEIRKAKWEEFDLEAAVWTIPEGRMKKMREHRVPLAPQVVGLLRQHAAVVGSSGWLFPGRRYMQPISEAALEAAMHSIGYKGRHTPHGFRAMAHTTLAEHLQVDERYIEKQLSHEEENKVKRAYNRAEFWAERVTMMNRWADFLDAQ